MRFSFTLASVFSMVLVAALQTDAHAARRVKTVASLTVSPSSLGVAVNATAQLTAVARDLNGRPVQTLLTWTSSNPAIATVSSTGVVFGLNEGSATISASAAGFTASSAVTVTAIAPLPSPTPTATPLPSPSPSPTPTVTPSPSPTPTASPSPTPTSSASPSMLTGTAAIDVEEQAFFKLINDYRAQNGLAPLKVSIILTKVADWLSVDMATYNYFSHTDRLGRAPSQRMIDFGYPYLAGWGEIIAAGNGTASATITQWKNSAPHNAIMLGAYVVIGCGRAYDARSAYGWYWTCDFNNREAPGDAFVP